METIAQKDFPENYSKPILRVLDALSMTDMKGMRLLGSSAIRSIQYAGDYDAQELVKAESAEAVAAKLQDIVKDVRSIDGLSFADIKCGEIPEWNVFHPNARVVDSTIENFNIKQSQSRVDALRAESIITKSEADTANALLERAINPPAFLEARKTIRFHILRWRPADILEGAMVYRDQVIKLEDAITSGGMIKIDTIANINDRFVEISAVYDIFIKGKRVTAPAPNVVIGLTEDIAYYSKTNPFKALKRAFALAKHFKNTKTLTALLPILNSDLGRLYQIIGDMGTIVELLGHPKPPLIAIRDSVDEFRSRLGSIYSLKDVLREEHDFIGDLYAILKMPSPVRMKGRLEKLMVSLKELLNDNTLKEMKRLGKLTQN